MTKTDIIAAGLHPLEKKVLPLIHEFPVFKMLSANSGLKEVEVMRAVQWLQNKKLIHIDEEVKEVILLSENGRKYIEKGLPEKRFLKALVHGAHTAAQVMETANITKEELNVCIGMLKKKAAIEMTNKNGELSFKLNEQGKKILEKPSLEEQFLNKQFPIAKNALVDEERFAHECLLRRKDIIRDDVVKEKTIKLTQLGHEVCQSKDLKKEMSERLTPEMLLTGSWKNHEFRPYDVQINVPSINFGRRHFVKSASEYARRVWLEMGFKEMVGPIVHTGFWNFDALFTAQDHPVREIQDTYYLENPRVGRLPDAKLVSKVKAMHENGGGTESKGWQYSWNAEEAKKNVLRTHTTVLSAQTLAQLKKDDLPAKYFAVGKCFRNETLDWSHLFEFNQFEGIVVDPKANFRHLLGYLKEFMKKIGFPKARFRPAYFPYTEPSVEIDAYHPVHKTWVELGGAGIFRPEVVIPLLGKDVPVLAWGPGLDRQMMEYYKINDIRMLYKNDIKQLREMKTWLK